MTKYIQTNEHGYVTGIVAEPALTVLFGGTKTLKIPDEQAASIEQLLDEYHRRGEGLHINDLVQPKDSEE